MNISRLLVGIDSSKEAQAAQRHALCIAHRMRAQMILAHACPRPESSLLGHNSAAVFRELVVPEIQEGCRAFDPSSQQAQVSGPRVSKLFIDGSPDPGLAEAANERNVDLIVVGTRGRNGIRRALLGSVAERTIRMAQTNVLVARGAPPGGNGYRHILVPTDFSDSAERALQLALSLASLEGAVDLIHCWSAPMRTVAVPIPAAAPAVAAASTESGASGPAPGSASDDARESALTEGRRLVARYRHESIKLGFELVEDSPINGILEHLESGEYDLCAMGSHGRRGWRRLLLGSAAESTVRRAPCSVLVSHAGA